MPGNNMYTSYIFEQDLINININEQLYTDVSLLIHCFWIYFETK